MSLVRWLRKNNKKLMAVFVILIMMSFLGLGQVMRMANQKASKEFVAYYRDSQKITNFDLGQARQELELLQALQAQTFLQSSDMRGLFLGEILFSERSIDPRVLSFLNQSIQQNGLRITPEQITRLYQGTTAPNVCWFLLKEEAHQAGMAMDTKTVKMLLNQVAKELFNGLTYKQLVQQTMSRFNMSEADILGTYSDLLSVLQFARMTTEMQDASTAQIKHMASWQNETLTAELVQLQATDFLKLEDPNAQPEDSVLMAHFNQYKSVEPGTPSEENPFGLGYKLPDRVKLEYMVIQLDDVQKTITKPTAQELEDYYQRIATSVFTVQVSADPNMADDDPNAPKKDVVRTYAEVASEVEKRLIVDKTIQKTSDMLQQAKPLVQIPLSEQEAKAKGPEAVAQIIDANNLSFSEAAKALKTSHPEVPVFTGTTGLLSQSDMLSDPSLRRLMASGAGNSIAQFVDVLFTVDPLESTDPSLMSMAKPWLFNTLGPIKDRDTRASTSVASQIMALIRIVAVAPSTEPATMADVYQKNGVPLSGIQEPGQVILKDLIVQDVKTLQAYEGLNAKAQELVDLAAAGSWESAVKQFNTQYGEKIKSTSTDDPNVFALQPKQLRRAPDRQIAQMASMAKMSPGFLGYVNSMRADNRVFETLYKLIPPEQTKLEDLPQIIASPLDYSVYCIKDLSVSRLSLQEYEKIKARMINDETRIAAQSLAIVHFTPDNIQSRMDFQWKETQTDDDTKDANNSEG